ncbi:hypothetical protein [Endozoicomonas sp. Mp262]|uniref:hypothetical protein n=1 Tax=Endozoicomonas sp. Mp262 TaxID=2919499 RepID=UPI0021DB1B7D
MAGDGCTCEAWHEGECGCDADWTDPEVYKLREENQVLKVERHELSDLLHECYKRLKHHDQHIAFHDQTTFMKKLEAILGV